MRRLLIDQSAPRGLKFSLTAFNISTAEEMGWAAVSNGELLTAAEAAGFAVLLTSDQNIRFQQSMAGRRIAVVSLGTNHWDTIRVDIPRVQDACDRAQEGTYVSVPFPKPPRRRRAHPRPYP